jgi:hypothetical protein
VRLWPDGNGQLTGERTCSPNVAYNHYSMMRTIEDGWHLGCLLNTCDTVNVPPMTDLVGP